MIALDTDPGTVYWVTGLPGAGKTTIGALFAARLKRDRPNLVFLDGDGLREALGNLFGYSSEERLQLASAYSRLCKLLAEQGCDVVCATVSMFEQVRLWNRANLRRYREIYVRAPSSVLLERDPKRLYSGAARGDVREVIGVDLDFAEPQAPDVILDNDGSRTPARLVDELMAKLAVRERA